MSVSDFVCYVLQVPATIDGFTLTCKAIQYVIDSHGDPRFYEYLQEHCNKSYASIEKSLRLAKNKSVERMAAQYYNKIYQQKEIKTKEFICYAAQYYRKEFLNEEQKA